MYIDAICLPFYFVPLFSCIVIKLDFVYLVIFYISPSSLINVYCLLVLRFNLFFSWSWMDIDVDLVICLSTVVSGIFFRGLGFGLSLLWKSVASLFLDIDLMSYWNSSVMLVCILCKQVLQLDTFQQNLLSCNINYLYLSQEGICLYSRGIVFPFSYCFWFPHFLSVSDLLFYVISPSINC